MILRKPYAFFIKVFKPIHLIMSFLVAFLIYKTTVILDFFNKYLDSGKSGVSDIIIENFVTFEIYIIPIVIILLSLVFLGIMFSKKKPYIFYLFTIFSFFIILIMNIYVDNFLNSMQNTVLQIKLVKLIHDLVVINIIIEIISFVILFIRGIGLDLRKINFDSDISKMDISEKDKEEVEIKLNLDIDNIKKENKRKIRIIKYFYKENKTKIFISLVLFTIIALITYFSYSLNKKNNYFKENVIYNVSNISAKVEKTLTLETSFNGEKISDNELIFVSFSAKTTSTNFLLTSKNVYLEIANEKIEITKKYNKFFLDLGNPYKNQVLEPDFQKYFIVFEIPKNHINEDKFLVFVNKGQKISIKLNPKKLIPNEEKIESSIGNTMKFKDDLSNISFKINSFDINKKFLIKYNFCIEKNCMISKEYITPSIDKNFDKVVLKLNVDFKNKSELDFNGFYKLFSTFGTIKYKIRDNWYIQKKDFEELKSKKVSGKNNVYVGVNSEIMNAESIIILFEIRGKIYEYKIK